MLKCSLCNRVREAKREAHSSPRANAKADVASMCMFFPASYGQRDPSPCLFVSHMSFIAEKIQECGPHYVCHILNSENDSLPSRRIHEPHQPFWCSFATTSTSYLALIAISTGREHPEDSGDGCLLQHCLWCLMESLTE